MFQIIDNAGAPKLRVTANRLKDVFYDSSIGFKYLLSGEQDLAFIGDYYLTELALEARTEEELLVMYLDHTRKYFQKAFKDVSILDFKYEDSKNFKRVSLILEYSLIDITKFYPLNEIKSIKLEKYEYFAEIGSYTVTLAFGR